MPSTVDVTPHAFQGETHVNMNNDPVYVRRRGIALGAAAVVVLLVAALLVAQLWGGGDDDSSGSSGSATSAASSSSDSDKDKKDKDAKGDEDDKDEPTQPSKVESSAPEESPAKKQGKKAAAKYVPRQQKSGPGVGGVLLIGVGVVALGALVFAAVQTLRADDELWVADDDADTKA